MSRNGGQPEALWQLSIFLIILVVATCLRFYALDQVSLSSDELKNLATCDIKGWLAIIMDYHGNNGGMPPLYPLLLCFTTHLTGDTEFFVRSLSALAGIGALYFIYMTGRDFLAPAAGLLAAAVVAAEFHVILVNRDATLYSLLTLFLLIHNYCFCRLFFSATSYISQPLTFSHTGTQLHFQWNWMPGFPGNARCLAGFWISGLAAFYTSPMALIQLISELLASALLIRQATCFPSWRAGMRSLWLPLLIGMLPWLPMFYKSSQWILQGNLFAFRGTAPVWQQMHDLVPIDPKFHYALIALTGIFLLSIAIINTTFFKRLKKIHPTTNPFCTYLLLQCSVAAISLWLILPASTLSYFYFWSIFIILIVMPVALCIHLIPANKFKYLITGIAVVAILITQIYSNTYYDLYAMGGNADFRLAAKIIHDDEGFMSGKKFVITTSNLFDHYLKLNKITTNNITVLNIDNQLPDYNSSAGNSEFYYLEYLPYDRELQNPTTTFQTLTRQYKKTCMTKLPWLRIVKFSRDAAVENVPQDCRIYLSGVVTLK